MGGPPECRIFQQFLRVSKSTTRTEPLGVHCSHSHAKVPRQCEADMSGKSVPHYEETGELEL